MSVCSGRGPVRADRCCLPTAPRLPHAGRVTASHSHRHRPSLYGQAVNPRQKTIAEPSIQSLYLVPAHRGTALASATGFVAQYGGANYLVTNWHVVAGRNPLTGQALDQPGGAVPDRVHVLHNQRTGLGHWQSRIEPTVDAEGTALWLEHPQHRRRADVVALRLTALDGVALYPYTLQPSGPQLAVGVSEAVSIVGFPFGRTGCGGFGIWSKGWLATEPDVDFDELPCFLIDSRTRQGQSGSPVIAYSASGGTFEGDSIVVGGGPSTRLLGVYSGRISAESDLGVVWKASALREILSSGVPGDASFAGDMSPVRGA